jgi:adenylate cyclase
VKKHLLRIGLGLLIVALFLGHVLRFYTIPFVDRMELISYDARLRLTMPRGIDRRIAIVDIDEKSLAVEGHWPWRRDKLAALLDRLFDHYGAGIVGFDIVFAERDESSGLKVLRDLATGELRSNAQYQAVLQRLEPKLEYDNTFAEKLRNRPVVLGYYFSSASSGTIGKLPAPAIEAGTFKGKNISFISYTGYGANLAQLQEAAADAGHFNPFPDEDGITRRVPILAQYEGAYYEALSLAVVRLGLGSPALAPGFAETPRWTRHYPGLEWLDIGKLRVPIDDHVTVLVPYRGNQGSFPYLSATDVLHGTAAVETLRDKIVLVGTTAPGLFDLRATPVDRVYPGVEIHANLIAGMIDGTIKQRPPYVLGAEVLLLLLCGTVMAMVLPFANPLRVTLITLLVLAAVFGVNLLVWTKGNLVLPLASGMLLIALLFALNMSYGFFVESRAKRQITGLFGQYVAGELVDEMVKNPESVSMEGESREMSVLFTDVRGFTTISEGLDPKQLALLMNEFLTPLTRVIYRHRGTIDKYMGDCIMAFWGAPLADPGHARNAVLAGLEMHRVLASLASDFSRRGWPEIRIGVGVNSGRMSVGNMGSEVRVAYTVMGDAVNLASRLEGATKFYGVEMIVGEMTRHQLSDFAFRELDLVKLKGKEEPVTIYEPLGPHSEVDKSLLDEVKVWTQALRFYRSRDWDMAELQLFNLIKEYPSRMLYRAFSDRISAYRSNPPEDGWDGAFRFETK